MVRSSQEPSGTGRVPGMWATQSGMELMGSVTNETVQCVEEEVQVWCGRIGIECPKRLLGTWDLP